MGSTVLDIIDSKVNIDDFPPDYHPPIFDIHETNIEKTIIDCISRLSSSKSCGFDGLTSFLVKICQYEIAQVLLFIFTQREKLRLYSKPETLIVRTTTIQ